MRSSIYLIMIRAHIRSSLLFFLVACSRRLSVVFVVFGVFFFVCSRSWTALRRSRGFRRIYCAVAVLDRGRQCSFFY